MPDLRVLLFAAIVPIAWACSSEDAEQVDADALGTGAELADAAAPPEPDWVDLGATETYADFAPFSDPDWFNKRRARCDTISTRRLGSGEILLASAMFYSSPSLVLITPMLVLTTEGFRRTDSQELKFLDTLWPADTGEAVSIRSSAGYDGSIDACGWTASATDEGAFTGLLSSDEARFSNRPGPSDHATLARLNPRCVVQGDWGGQAPPCTRVSLFAVTDLDGDGLSELWYTVPYMWDTGFEVAEVTVDGSGLDVLASVCWGCDQRIALSGSLSFGSARRP